MKKLLLLLAFIATMLTSCVNNAEIDYSGKDAVDVVIGINVPELAASRAGETDMNSGLGAIDNFTADEWAKYDVRYIFEVYDATEGYEDFDNPVKKRFVETHDMYEPTTFSLRLIPNRTYKFVVWADFVLQGSEDDLNYDTTDLKNISRIGNNTAYTTAMDESMDAYFIQENIYLEKNLSKSLTLTRPFGKIRVIATDVNEVNIGSEPKSVKVKFYDTDIFTSLNALTGEAETETQTVEYSYDIAKDTPYTQGYDADAKNQTLFADYILAQPKSAGAQEVNFTMEVIGVDNRMIRSHDFNTQIPLQRNHLTTIMGNLLTTSTEFQIFIDDNFDGEYVIDTNHVLTEAIEVRGGYNYSEGDEAGNYVITISDNGFDAENNVKDNSSYYCISFYGAIVEGETDGTVTIPVGVYSLDKANTGAADTIEASWSFLHKSYDAGSWDDDEFKYYDDATLVVTEEGLTFTAMIEDVEHVVTYTGSLEILDYREEQPTEGVTFEANYIYGEYDYYGDEGGNYVIYLSDNGFVDGDEPLPNSTYYCLDFYGAKVEGESNGYVTIPAGEYHFVNEDNGLVGSITGPYSYLIKTGDYTSDEDIEPEVDMFEDAVLVVTADGLELVAVIEGVEHHVTYTGSLEINDCREPAVTPLETPAVEAEVESDVVTLSWEAVANADDYAITLDGAEYTTTATTYTFDLAYDTEYTFTIVARSENERYSASEAATVTITTEADPYVYLKPSDEWLANNARFAVYTYTRNGFNGDGKWFNMVDSDGDGYYEVLKSNLKTYVTFARMRSTSSSNNWGNILNQANNLTVPTNGDNLYIVETGTWSKK